MEGELLTLEDVAKRLDVPPRFVRRLVAERRITYHKVGRYVRFHERDIADYLAANRIEAMTASTIPRRTTPRTTRRPNRRASHYDPKRGQTRFGVWADQWLKGATLRPKTRTLYGYLLRRFIKPTFTDIALNDIDDSLTADWLAELRELPDISETTVAKAYRLFARIMGQAVESRYIVHTTWKVKGAGRERSPEMRFATPEQVSLLASKVPERYRALILVAAYGGLRWGELVNLRRRHVDLRRGTVQVVEQATELAGKFTVAPVKSEAGALSGSPARCWPCCAGTSASGRGRARWPGLPGASGRVPAARQLPSPRVAAGDEDGQARGPPIPRPSPHRCDAGRGRWRDHQGADGADGPLHAGHGDPLSTHYGGPRRDHRRVARSTHPGRRQGRAEWHGRGTTPEDAKSALSPEGL